MKSMSNDEIELIKQWSDAHLVLHPEDKEICESIVEFVSR